MMVTGSPRLRCASTSRSSQAILSREYCQNGIAQRRRLGDRKPARRLLIGRRRADEDVLAGAPLEEVEILLDVLRREGEEFGDDVVVGAGNRVARRGGIADIRDELVGPLLEADGERSRD